ncbi:MAG TPA: terminase family protein, partial [bacterium]|nr:terminase family protein [bacterium]
HKTGGNSTVHFMSYEMGREKWQGDTLDFVWFDEEPPEDIYSEGKTRTQAGDNNKGGMVFVTFTPLLGMSNVVRRFLQEKPAGTAVVNMTIYDVDHYTDEQRKKIIAGYLEHEREARSMGTPIMGTGRVFMVAESAFVIAPVQIPEHWWLIGGIDFGIDHPTAWAGLAWDKDQDVIYLCAEHRLKGANIATNAAAIKRNPRFANAPVAWPHDGAKRDAGSGEAIGIQYKRAGLRMLPAHATDTKGTNSVEGSVAEINEQLQTGKFKVFNTCQMWLEEYRMYHRKDGLIVKLDDDLISASRYGHMMRRFAKPASECWDLTKKRKQGTVAQGVHYDTLNFGFGERPWQ